jgi:hypothetical protein
MRAGIFGTVVGEWAGDRRYSSLRGACPHIRPCKCMCDCEAKFDVSLCLLCRGRLLGPGWESQFSTVWVGTFKDIAWDWVRVYACLLVRVPFVICKICAYCVFMYSWSKLFSSCICPAMESPTIVPSCVYARCGSLAIEMAHSPAPNYVSLRCCWFVLNMLTRVCVCL